MLVEKILEKIEELQSESERLQEVIEFLESLLNTNN